MGDRLDVMVQKYVAKLREEGGIINTDIVISGAHGILKSVNRTRLMEFGGHVRHKFMGQIINCCIE